MSSIYERMCESRIIDAGSGCWYRLGWKQDDYSKTPMVSGLRERSHMWAFRLFTGPIPPGHDIDHKCMNRGCWNPDHLQSLTKSNHSKVTWSRGERKSKRNQHTDQTHCKYGHEFTDANTKPMSGGRRQCRECERRRKRESYARRSHS